MKTDISDLYGKSLHRNDYGEWEYDLELKRNNPPPVTFSFVRAIRNGHKRVQKGIHLDKPILVMHSDHSVYEKKWSEDFKTKDAVLSVKHIKENAQKINGDVQIIEIKNALHDLILSRKDVREEVYQKLFTWLKSFS
jgi:alpha-beta hydrolase superfamily lysophospholipase